MKEGNVNQLYLISVDKTFKGPKGIGRALRYWQGVGRTVRLAKVNGTTANFDFLVKKGDEAIVFKSDYSYRVNSVRHYDFTKEQFLVKGITI